CLGRGRMARKGPVRVAVVDDYDVIVEGVAALLAPQRDLVEVVDWRLDGGPRTPVDVALIDCFALPGDGAATIRTVARHPNVDKVVVYTWANAPELIDAAVALGVGGYASKGLSG